jgi:DNA-binding CsgD family transcriptional regulator
MLTYLVYLIFIISVAMAAGGIILASRLRNRYRSGPFSSLLYFEVFIYTFGFYGIWGRVLIKSFLSPVISVELLHRFTDISMLLGLPFLVFAWLMLTIYSFELSGRKENRLLIFWFLVVNFIILVLLGYLITRKKIYDPMTVLKTYFISFNIVYYFLAAYMIHFRGKSASAVNNRGKSIVAPVMFSAMLIQCIPLLFYTSQFWLGMTFIFTFFLGNTVLPVLLTYGSLISIMPEEQKNNLSFEEFCRKYEVSQRESEIIMEICNGLTNQDISDKLFISLQTVKDHTHRIYIKTNVKSRVQLINLVKNSLVV